MLLDATSQGNANTTQNGSATLALDDTDTLDLNIGRLQRDDPVLSKIFEVSQNNPHLPYCVVNVVLFTMFQNLANSHKDITQRLLLVVPPALQKDVLT